jgi:hypothetical protein
MRKGVTLTGLVVALVALAGCGGSDSSGDSGSTSSETTEARSGKPLTRAKFIKQADAICADNAPEREAVQKQVGELVEEINAGEDAAREELADLLDEAADTAKQEFDELRALVPPTADTRTIDTMLASAAAQTTLTREGVEDLRKSDYQAFTEVTESAVKLRARADLMALNYGLEVCGAESE